MNNFYIYLTDSNPLKCQLYLIETYDLQVNTRRVVPHEKIKGSWVRTGWPLTTMTNDIYKEITNEYSIE